MKIYWSRVNYDIIQQIKNLNKTCWCFLLWVLTDLSNVMYYRLARALEIWQGSICYQSSSGHAEMTDVLNSWKTNIRNEFLLCGFAICTPNNIFVLLPRPHTRGGFGYLRTLQGPVCCRYTRTHRRGFTVLKSLSNFDNVWRVHRMSTLRVNYLASTTTNQL